MTCLTIGSLFSGIGGLELGLEWATGGRTLWNCEINPFCRQVLARHWPDATQYEDVREINETVAPVDILCGGFPCQNLSISGDRTGLAGEQSGLWREYARVVRLLRPRFVFVENVPALRNFVSDDGLGRVLGDLAEVGYDAEWDCVPAAAVGAPHVRDRIFILAWQRELVSSAVGHPHDTGRAERRRPGTVRPQVHATERDGRGVSHGGFPPPPGDGGWPRWLEEHPTAQPGLRREVDGIPGELDPHRRSRLRALGNAVVPQAAAAAWKLLVGRAGIEL